MAQGLHGARRPRPVADIARPALADGTICAKGWLLALVAATSIEKLGALSTAQLAAEAPALCAAVLPALGSDRELERLEPGGDRAALAARAGRLAGATDAAGVARAVGLLREAIWDALLDELDRRDGELVAAAAARLAHVCDVVAQAALAAGAPAVERAAPSERPRSLAPVPEPPRTGPVGIVDAPPPEPVPDVVGEVVARRSDGGSEPWLDAVAAQLRRHGDDGEPFAVLAVDVDDAERLLAADGDGEALRAITRAEGAVRRIAGSAEAVVREHPGRLWIVVSGDGAKARALGERLAEAAAKVVLRGAPLTVSIGVAVSPEDGADAPALVGHADEGVFAARAAGVRLA